MTQKKAQGGFKILNLSYQMHLLISTRFDNLTNDSKIKSPKPFFLDYHIFNLKYWEKKNYYSHNS